VTESFLRVTSNCAFQVGTSLSHLLNTCTFPLPHIHHSPSLYCLAFFKMIRPFRPQTAFNRSSRLIAAWQSSKSYSIKAEAASTTKLQDIDPSKVTVQKSTTPKDLLPLDQLVFGRTFTGKLHFLHYEALHS
jgi:hypothetical protein